MRCRATSHPLPSALTRMPVCRAARSLVPPRPALAPNAGLVRGLRAIKTNSTNPIGYFMYVNKQVGPGGTHD